MSSKKPGLSREDAIRVSLLIKYLIERPESYEFLRPLEYKALGLLDYPALIKKPMDLSTVKKHLKSGNYSTVEEALADLVLIWDNCMSYYSKEQPIHQQALKMEEYMLEYLKDNSWNMTLPSKRSRDENEPVTLQRKIDLIQGMKELSEEEVGKIVDTIFEMCPRAIAKLPNDRVKLNVDHIDQATFNKVFE